MFKCKYFHNISHRSLRLENVFNYNKLFGRRFDFNQSWSNYIHMTTFDMCFQKCKKL